MELIVAIIWYLNLMAPNTEYHVAEINSVVNANPEVMMIADDVEKATDVWIEFNSSGGEVEIQADIIEWWEEDTSCSYTLDPIPSSVMLEMAKEYRDAYSEPTDDTGTTENSEGETSTSGEDEGTQSEKEK